MAISDFPRAVQLLAAAVTADAHKQALGDGNISLAQLIAEYIDEGGIFNHQICRLPASRHLDDVNLFRQLAIDFPGVAFVISHNSFRLSGYFR